MKGPQVAVVALSDGRPGVGACVESLDRHVTGNIVERWMHDDSGDRRFRDGLVVTHPGWVHVGEGPRRGFTGMMRHVRELVWKNTTADYVFWVEADFVVTRRVDLDAIVRVLDGNPQIAQMALVRQACNPVEKAAGGVVESWPHRYVDRSDGISDWLEHRLFWTCNPHVARASELRKEWPDRPGSEEAYGRVLFRDPLVTCGYWGRRGDGPWCTHVGQQIGTGY